MKRIQLTEKKISSGLTVIHLQTTPSCLFEASIHFRVGSGIESEENNGVSHLLEHMMFRGSGEHPNSLSFSRALESICGETNAFTSAETTEYWFQCAHAYSSQCLQLMFSFLNEPKFDQFEIEKRIIFQEIDEDYNENGLLIDDFCLAMKAHFGSRGLGLPIGGTRAGLETLTLDHIKKHRLDGYDPRHAILTIQSCRSPAEVMEACEQHLGQWRSSEKINGPLLAPNSERLFDGDSRSQKRVAVNHSDNQFALRLSFAVPISERNLATELRLRSINILKRILDDGTASRLQSTIRETLGLVYTISAGVNEYVNALTFDIEATVAPEHLIETYEQILTQIEMLKTNEPSEAEFERAMLRAHFEIERLEENHRDFLEHLVYSRFHGVEFDATRSIETLKKVSPASTRTAAAEIFQASNLALVLVGPNAEKWIGKLRTLC